MALTGKNEMDILLAKSLKELAQNRPFEKITIKEITDKAGVIRPTFYNHFQDKYELLEWIFRVELFEPIQPLLKAGMVTEAMVLLFTNIQNDGKFYTRIVKMEGMITFHDIAKRCVEEVLVEMIKEVMTGRTSKHKWLSPEVIAAYYAQSMCFAFEEWIHTGMSIPPKEMAEAYHYIMTRSMEDVIREI